MNMNMRPSSKPCFHFTPRYSKLYINLSQLLMKMFQHIPHATPAFFQSQNQSIDIENQSKVKGNLRMTYLSNMSKFIL